MMICPSHRNDSPLVPAICGDNCFFCGGLCEQCKIAIRSSPPENRAMKNPASNFGATPARGVYEGKIDGSKIVSPKDPREFLSDLDNELSAAIRKLQHVRRLVQRELGWTEIGDDK